MNVSNNAFRFCRWSVTVLVWVALLLKLKWLVVFAFVVVLLSAILKVSKAPMIVFYNLTFEKIKKSKKVDLDEYAMRVAHTIAATFLGICAVLIFIGFKYAYGVLFVFAIIKTISALGVCPVYKATTCARSGCCSLSKKLFKKE